MWEGGVKQVGTHWATSMMLIVVLHAAGCPERPKPLPRTYPVHGKVVYKDGAPVTNGLVQFQPEAEPTVTTTAAIRSDGAYSLITTRDGLRAEGAVAGSNRVIVIAMDRNNSLEGAAVRQQGRLLATYYPTSYNVESRDNELNVTVERPPSH